MPKQQRPIKFHISLTPQEKEQAQRMAQENNLSMAELFRAKTLKRRLPRKVTKVAVDTYRELGRIGNNINQIAKAVNAAIQMGEPVVVERGQLDQLSGLLRQLRKEIADVDTVAELEDGGEVDSDDWQTSQRSQLSRTAELPLQQTRSHSNCREHGRRVSP